MLHLLDTKYVTSARNEICGICWTLNMLHLLEIRYDASVGGMLHIFEKKYIASV